MKNFEDMTPAELEREADKIIFSTGIPEGKRDYPVLTKFREEFIRKIEVPLSQEMFLQKEQDEWRETAPRFI